MYFTALGAFAMGCRVCPLCTGGVGNVVIVGKVGNEGNVGVDGCVGCVGRPPAGIGGGNCCPNMNPPIPKPIMLFAKPKYK